MMRSTRYSAEVTWCFVGADDDSCTSNHFVFFASAAISHALIRLSLPFHTWPATRCSTEAPAHRTPLPRPPSRLSPTCSSPRPLLADAWATCPRALPGQGAPGAGIDTRRPPPRPHRLYLLQIRRVRTAGPRRLRWARRRLIRRRCWQPHSAHAHTEPTGRALMLCLNLFRPWLCHRRLWLAGTSSVHVVPADVVAEVELGTLG